MGIPIPAPEITPGVDNHCYPPGLTPDTLFLTFSGIERALWPGTPPHGAGNGSYLCVQQNLVAWRGEMSGFTAQLVWHPSTGTHITLVGSGIGAVSTFTGNSVEQCLRQTENLIDPHYAWWAGGSCIVTESISTSPPRDTPTEIAAALGITGQKEAGDAPQRPVDKAYAEPIIASDGRNAVRLAHRSTKSKVTVSYADPD